MNFLIFIFSNYTLYLCWGLENRRRQQQGILPSQCSQLARDCLVWGIRPACGLATIGQVTKIKGFTGCGPVHRVYFCVFFSFKYEMQVPIWNADWSRVRGVVTMWCTLVLNSLASKSHTVGNKLTKLSLGREIIIYWVMYYWSCIKKNHR